jgi:hypothetical protein
MLPKSYRGGRNHSNVRPEHDVQPLRPRIQGQQQSPRKTMFDSLVLRPRRYRPKVDLKITVTRRRRGDFYCPEWCPITDE